MLSLLNKCFGNSTFPSEAVNTCQLTWAPKCCCEHLHDAQHPEGKTPRLRWPPNWTRNSHTHHIRIILAFRIQPQSQSWNKDVEIYIEHSFTLHACFSCILYIFPYSCISQSLSAYVPKALQEFFNWCSLKFVAKCMQETSKLSSWPCPALDLGQWLKVGNAGCLDCHHILCMQHRA